MSLFWAMSRRLHPKHLLPGVIPGLPRPSSVAEGLGSAGATSGGGGGVAFTVGVRAGGIAAEFVSTEAVVATGALGCAPGCAAGLGLVAPAAGVSEGVGCIGWDALCDAVSVLVVAEASGAFAFVLLIRG